MESITKTTFTETTVKRVTNTAVTEQVALRRSGGPLGLSIIGGSDHSCVPFGTGEQGIYVSKIIAGGSAAATGKLRMGDRILAVNTTDIRNVTHQEAVMSLLQPCEIIKLTVQHDPLPPGFMEITVRKEEGEKLGMIVKGGLRGQPGNPEDPSDEGVFCVKVNPGSIASTDSRIKVGQRIIEVNGQSLLGATHTEAVNILRNAGNTIKLLVCDGFNPSPPEDNPDPILGPTSFQAAVTNEVKTRQDELNSSSSSGEADPNNSNQTVILANNDSIRSASELESAVPSNSTEIQSSPENIQEKPDTPDSP